MSVPEGTTHVHVFYGVPSFWRTKASEYSRELAKWWHHWHYWDNGKWVEDRTVSTRDFQRISDYLTEQDTPA